jgi:hypothetical protein
MDALKVGDGQPQVLAEVLHIGVTEQGLDCHG